MKSLFQRDISTSLFTEALFLIVNTWKQPKCYWQMTEKMYVYIYICMYIHSYHEILFCQKIKVNLFVTRWMDLEGIMLSREISQAEKNKYHMSLLIYRIKKKNIQPYRNRTDWWLPEVGDEGWGNGWRVVKRHRLLKWDKFWVCRIQHSD